MNLRLMVPNEEARKRYENNVSAYQEYLPAIIYSFFLFFPPGPGPWGGPGPSILGPQGPPYMGAQGPPFPERKKFALQRDFFFSDQGPWAPQKIMGPGPPK